MRRSLKAVLGWMAFRSGVYRRYLRDRAVIVLFHRVDDRYADNPISCSSAQFARFLGFFRRFFQVVSLEQLLARLRDGKSLGGYMAITFDDGYLDNHRTAAPALARHGLPACFFIATEFIASERVPRWDAEAGIFSEWMSWDDVRSLHAQGFEVGSHTMNHVDLGVMSGDEADREIVGSKDRLERELGATIHHFTYPFGRPHHITEENRRRVEAAGFTCCLSAFGGSVVAGDDPFDLKRTPVSPWYVSPYQFGFELMRERC